MKGLVRGVTLRFGKLPPTSLLERGRSSSRSGGEAGAGPEETVEGCTRWRWRQKGMSGVICRAGLVLGPCAEEAVQGEASGGV